MLVSIHLVVHGTGEIIFEKYYGRRLGAVRPESRKPEASEWLKRLGEKRLHKQRGEYLKRLKDATISYSRIWNLLKEDRSEHVTTFEQGSMAMEISQPVQVICKAIGTNDTVLLLCGTEDNNATLLFPVASSIDKMVRDACGIMIPTGAETAATGMVSVPENNRGDSVDSAESRIRANHSKLLAAIDQRFGDGEIDIVPFVLSIGNTIKGE